MPTGRRFTLSKAWRPLVLLVPLYAVVVYLGWYAFIREPPSVMGEPYRLEEPETEDDSPRVR